jgi:hypothetical protein
MSNEKKYKKYLDFIIDWVRSWTEEIELEEDYVESFESFEEFMGRVTPMEVLGADIRKVLDEYIAVTWIPIREKRHRHAGWILEQWKKTRQLQLITSIPPCVILAWLFLA